MFGNLVVAEAVVEAAAVRGVTIPKDPTEEGVAVPVATVPGVPTALLTALFLVAEVPCRE